jgi:hypothetical protein
MCFNWQSASSFRHNLLSLLIIYLQLVLPLTAKAGDWQRRIVGDAHQAAADREDAEMNAESPQAGDMTISRRTAIVFSRQDHPHLMTLIIRMVIYQNVAA